MYELWCVLTACNMHIFCLQIRSIFCALLLLLINAMLLQRCVIFFDFTVVMFFKSDLSREASLKLLSSRETSKKKCQTQTEF